MGHKAVIVPAGVPGLCALSGVFKYFWDRKSAYKVVVTPVAIVVVTPTVDVTALVLETVLVTVAAGAASRAVQ